MGRPGLPERELFLGRPAGSAMPLAWAHAEHVKRAVFDMPPRAAQSYIGKRQEIRVQSWRTNAKIKNVIIGRGLRLELLEPAKVRWSSDNWKATNDMTTTATGFGTYICDLPTQALRADETVVPTGTAGACYPLG